MDNGSWLTPDESRVFRAFNRSWQAVMAQLDEDLDRDVGLPRTYFGILWRLRRAPDRSMRMADLAARTGSKASRMTHAVGRLEADGLVRREQAPGDRRGWVAVLTDEGLAVAERAAPRYADSVRAHLLHPLTPAMRSQLTEIGETLLGTLAPDRLPGADDPS
jgi:DNA-binding MarR family transcriptional regulator